MTIRSYTRMQLTIEVSGSTYGPEWSIGEIVKQAKDEIPNGVRERLRDIGITIIGEPVVKVVSTVDDGK